MNTAIAVIDAVSILAFLAALVIVCFKYNKVFREDVSFALAILLFLSASFMTCVFLKWSGLVNTILIVEDTLGTLLPIGWMFLFYTMVHGIIKTETLNRQNALKQEISERTLAEIKARQYNIKLGVIVDNVSSALLMETAERKIEFANRLFCQMLSVPLTPDSLKGLDCQQSAKDYKNLFKHPEDFCASIEAAVSGGQEVYSELFETIDNRFYERDYIPVYDNNQLVYNLWIYRDVTHRVLAEKALESAAQEWRTTFDSISDMIAVTDVNHIITRINWSFASAFSAQPTQLLGFKACALIHGREGPEEDCPCVTARKICQPVTREYLHPDKKTSMEITSSPINDANGNTSGNILVIRDITERKLMQQQMILQDRLASIGELVSGVAHELNNPLTSVIGFSDYLLQGEPSGETKELLEHINRDAKRTASIVNDLMVFAREQPAGKSPLDINEILKRVLSLHTYLMKVKNITVQTHLSQDLPLVMGSSTQLHQVFSNIIVNAEQVMSKSDKAGELYIETRKANQAARIIIKDNGPGIEEDVIGKIFNPFFTTREVGCGTGLGLSICYGIVTGHGGSIRAESEPGNGATFIIELPCID